MTTRTLTLLADCPGLVLNWEPDNSFTFSAFLEPGLYTFGLQADLSKFDWENLYYPMTRFGNQGQRTGPWDFDLNRDNIPLLPTWRIRIDGCETGLFYLQRPTVEDLARRTLRGEFGFYVARKGTVTVQAAAHHPFTLEPLAAYLEPNALDCLEEPAWAARGLAANWAAATCDPRAWDALREPFANSEWRILLIEGLRRYREILKPAGGGSAAPPPDALPTLIAARRLLDDPAAIDQARGILRHYLARAAWGNPNPDGYGHNGDMGCALVLKHLALALAWMTDDELGDLRQPVLARLEAQMDRFLAQQLLMAHYWGGAVVQDHGFRSSASAAFAALALLGHSPRAPFWLAFYLPRIRRTLRALPRDGFIPFSSYHKLSLYGPDMADLHVALKFASGESILDEACYRHVPDFLLATLEEESMCSLVSSTRGDRKTVNHGLGFLLSLARDGRSRKAAWLARRLLDRMQSDPDLIPPGYTKPFETLPFCILGDPAGPARPPRPRVARLNHFPDGGFIAYRDPARRLHVSVNAYPPCGAFHALGTDLSGTDMGQPNPSAGHFSVAIGDEPLIQNAESGYRTGSALSNVPLFDGQGQFGDMGYPMGVPVAETRCARIQNCQADGRGGRARINLAPAYPESLGVLTATRDFWFSPGRLTVTDTLITREPRSVSWAFHSWARHGLAEVGPGRYRFSHGADWVDLAVSGAGLMFALGDTEVVWAYGNEQQDQPFRQLACRTPAVCATRVRFTITCAHGRV